MDKSAQFNSTATRLCETMLDAIDDFRSGNDRQGLDEFLAAMEDLEMILDMDRYSGTAAFEMHRIQPILEELSALVKNQDIVGITDLLELALYPLAKEMAEDDGNDDSKAR